MRRRRGLEDVRTLCSGPGKLCEALGITVAHSALPLDQPPYALYARTGKVDVVTGLRIGITKAVDLPWRYGLKGSKFVSKPFPEETVARSSSLRAKRSNPARR
jgi:DNA-3-methyladenine glycosylase